MAGWRPLVRHAPLWRAAIWRPVKCLVCGLLNMCTGEVVQRGRIPDLLAREEVPNLMMLLTDCHVADPQVMFMAAVDVISDQASLQIGQFEATAELMDQCLSWGFI